MRKVLLAALFSVFALGACSNVQDHRANLSSTNEREMTVGTVQKEIRKGMSGAEVVEALGSPNMVTRDEKELETWVYDKIATEASYSQSSGGLFLLLGGVASSSGAASVTQKTLTVVIKFNKDGKVDSYSYHASKF
jgi:outer membrane protein assembly factor BamE (lipoprotein component of BamABCDE complex)